MLKNNDRSVPTAGEVEEVLKQGPTITLKFPCEVFQTDSHTISVPVMPTLVHCFDEEFVKYCHEKLGEFPAAVFLDQMRDKITRGMLVAQIR